MANLDNWATILAAAGPVATAALGVALKRSDVHKTRKLDEVAEQVKANGGATMRDAVDRIEGALLGLTERIEQLEIQRADRRRRWGR